MPIAEARKKTMHTFKELTDGILREITILIENIKNQHTEELTRVVTSHLLALAPPESIEREIPPLENYLVKIFHSHSEIVKSLEMLRNIPFYISRFPYSKTRITREEYMRFHVEAFFNEIYIFKERLEKYCKTIERQFKSDPSTPNAKQQISEATTTAISALSELIKKRGAHVHEKRLDESNIDRIGTLELLWRNSEGAFYEITHYNYKKEVRRIKKIWKENMEEIITQLEEILNNISSIIYPIIFNLGTNTLRQPHGVR